MSKLYYISSILLVFSALSCRKDKTVEIDCCSNYDFPNCANSIYANYATDNFDKVLKDVNNPNALIGPFFFSQDDYSVGAPLFNPHDPYEIIYAKSSENSGGQESELWKFNFCNGNSELIASDFLYDADWSIDDWLIYTGTNNQIFKRKSNGDSLIQLTNQTGFNNVGKWSPKGTKFFMTNNSFKIMNKDGIELYTTAGLAPFRVVDWLNDSLLLVVYNGKFQSFNYQTEDYNIVQNGTTNICQACEKIFDRLNKRVFISSNNGEGNGEPDWVVFDLESGETTILQDLEPSYNYGHGHYTPLTDKLILLLQRQDWKDSLQNEIYTRKNLILLNSDGTDERIIELPH